MAKKKWLVVLVALVVVAGLCVVLVASGGQSDPPPGDENPTTTEEIYTAQQTTQEQTTQEEDTTSGYERETTITQPEDGQTETEPANVTTTQTATAAQATPSTTAEIVAFYNDAANRVKTQRLGFSHIERTIIDESRIEANRALSTVLPMAIRTSQSTWGSFTDPVVVAPGANHNSFPAEGQSWSSRLRPEWVQSATITRQGNDYHIRIVLRDERVPELPRDATTTRHGQVMPIYTHDEIMEGVERIPGVGIQRWDATYTGSYVEATICRQTGNMKRARFFANSQVELTVRAVGLTTSASLPLAQEYIFTLNYR